jgi:hypothetical protein
MRNFVSILPSRFSLNEQIYYECQRCTNCCRWPGIVAVSEAEIAAIARFLALDERDFIGRFTRLRPSRDGLSLIEKPNGECHFLEGRDCLLQPVKPEQCRAFPNGWNFPGWREQCEAVPTLRHAPDAAGTV